MGQPRLWLAVSEPARLSSASLAIFMITIPNTFDGAVLLSIIDFVLSFFIISGIGVVLALLPFVNRFWKIDEAKLRRGGH